MAGKCFNTPSSEKINYKRQILPGAFLRKRGKDGKKGMGSGTTIDISSEGSN